MAHKTADGKRSFTNKPQADAYNRKNKNGTNGGPAQPTDPGPARGAGNVAGANAAGNAGAKGGGNLSHAVDAQGSQDEDQMRNLGEEQDGGGLAAAHGPASQVSMTHDHAANIHDVVVQHPDGHTHQTSHSSADAAYKFGADCAGCKGDAAMM